MRFLDLRAAIRSLTQSPGFLTAAVLSLSVAIGAGAAAFSVVDAVRFRTLPFPDGDRLVVLSERPESREGVACRSACDVSYETWANRLRPAPARSLDAVAAYTRGGKALNLGGEPILVFGGVVSPNLFDLLEVKPARGRAFTAEDDRLGTAPVVMVSHDLWVGRFGSDPDIVGRSVRLSDTDYTVIGVMPPGFNHEVDNQFWLPVVPTLDPSTRPSIRSLTVIGRLAPGRTLAQLNAELATLGPLPAERTGPGSTPMKLEAAPLRSRYAESTRSHDLIFAAVVTGILIIAVANLANLVLVRSLHHRREFAIRSALGARGGRLVREQFAQQLIIVGASAVLGVVVAAWLLGILQSVDVPQSIRPSGMEYRLDLRSIGFTAGLALLIGAMLSLVPARVAARTEVQALLREGGPGTAGGGRGLRVQRAFVVAQIAIAVMLVTGAGLMAHTVIRLSRVQLGFEPASLVEASPSFPHSWRVKDRFLPVTRDIADQLALLPGVSGVAIRSMSALGPRGASSSISLEGQAEPLPPGLVPRDAVTVSPGYFRFLGIRLVRGREFEAGDREISVPVALINQWTARRWWPGQDPLGRTIRVDTAAAAAPVVLTIVGVVADNRAAQPNLLLAGDGAEVYRPYEQAPSAFPTFLVRTSDTPEPLLRPARELLARLVPDRPVFATLVSERVDDQLRGVRVNALQILGFAVVGLGLALVGIYGVLSYSVSRRTRELGVRGALGASRSQLTTLVLRDAARLTAVGLLIGLPLTSLALRPIESALHGTSRTDGVVYGVVAALVLLVTLVASLVPARRASRIDASIALRD